jgi:NAD(P)-dependent dehydrogenase (short-subunit alcohol dehydrogenase family)
MRGRSTSWRWPGTVAVVTGASSGIGEASARRLATAGATVYAAARRTARLERLADEHPGIVPVRADVTEDADVDALAARVRDDHGRCHLLVNNAGVGGGALHGRDDLDEVLRTLDVNLACTVRCLAAFADLLERGAPSRGVNVASVAGKVGIGPAGYAASKFGMVGLSESLHPTWARRGITVIQLNPGFVATEGFPQRALLRTPARRLVGEPDDVAVALVDAVERGRWERTVPRGYRAVVLLRHLLPGAYRAAAARLEGGGAARRRQ